MRLIDVIPITRIPHTQTQILSYFFSSDLAPGSLVLIPLGKRKETGVVLGSRDIDKMQIKKADFSLRNIIKVINEKPILTSQQIELALFLGQYYFASPGLFLKMALPPQYCSSPSTSLRVNSRREVLDSAPQNAGLRSNNKELFQKLILAPTIASAKKISLANKKATLWHSDLTAKQKDEIWWKIKNGQAHGKASLVRKKRDDGHDPNNIIIRVFFGGFSAGAVIQMGVFMWRIGQNST